MGLSANNSENLMGSQISVLNFRTGGKRRAQNRQEHCLTSIIRPGRPTGYIRSHPAERAVLVRCSHFGRSACFSCSDDLEEQQFVAKDLVEWRCMVNAFVQQYQSSHKQSSRSTIEGVSSEGVAFVAKSG